jgi:hypothetical protein
MSFSISRLNWALGALAWLFGFVFYFAIFGNLFLLVEYRQQIQGNTVGSELYLWLKNVFFLDPLNPPFGRYFSLLIATIITALAGLSAPAHNAVHLLFLTFPAAALVWVIGRGSLRASLAGLLAAGFYLFEVPIIDAASWQSTFLDETSVFLVALTITLAARLRLSVDERASIIAWNIGLFVLFACAYLTKEAPWPLAPTVTLILFLRQLPGALQSGRRPAAAVLRAGAQTLMLAGLPLLWATIYVLRMYGAIQRTEDASRLMGGDVLGNIRNMGSYFVNGEVGNVPTLIIDYSVMAVIVAVGLLTAGPRVGMRAQAGYIATAFLAFLLACAIPLRTMGVSPFYLLVAAFFLALTLGLSTGAILQALSNRRVAAAAAAGFALLLALQLPAFWREGAVQREVAGYSPHFRETLRVVGERIAENRPQSISLIYSDKAKRGYMFTEQIGLAAFILPSNTPKPRIAALDRIISTQPRSLRVDPAPKPGELLVLMDDQMGPGTVMFKPRP